MARTYAIPSAWTEFRRDWRSITNPAECSRLARALDRGQGLIDDHLRAFRVGRVYFLLDVGDGGMVVTLGGSFIAVYIRQP